MNLWTDGMQPHVQGCFYCAV